MGELARMDDREGLRGNFSYSYDDDKKGIEDNINNGAVRKNTPYYYLDFKENVQFILNHFQGPLFTRTISTKSTGSRQKPVYNIDQIYKEFEKSNFIDCRISAFPLIANPIPDFIFIDLDNDNNSKIFLETKLEITLANIKKRLGGHPTILWTGNGFHIYQPFKVPTRLSEMNEFEGFEDIDNKFLQFEKDFLSNGYADKKNHPSLKSCLLRVPGSLNSKCLTNGLSEEDSKVKIIQKWDGKRIPISYQIGTLHAYLVSESQKKEKNLAMYTQRQYSGEPGIISWIEKLLETPIDDHRYLCVWHILIPYLVNVKQVKEPEVYTTVETWLRECNKKRRVEFDSKYTIKYNMKKVKDFGPISLEDLKKEYPDLYELVKD